MSLFAVCLRTRFVLLCTVAVLAVCPSVCAETLPSEIIKVLQVEVGEFHQTKPPKPSDLLKRQGFTEATDGMKAPSSGNPSQAFEAEYAASNGEKFDVV